MKSPPVGRQSKDQQMTPNANPLLNVTRRHFFKECGVGVGKIALASLLTDQLGRSSTARATTAGGAAPGGFALAPAAGLMSPKLSHHPGRAKAVIQLFMAGAPSQLDMFDYKPELLKLAGKPLPPSVYAGQRYAFIRPDAAVMGPQFKFAKHGQSGLEVSEVIPHLASVADDICVIRSMKTDQFNHAPAQIFMNTGFSQPGRPSMGSWATYGLGSEAQDLPAFVVMSTGTGISGGAANWSSGFLPTVYTGVRFRNGGDPILNVSSPDGVDPRLQRDTLDLVSKLNRRRLAADNDPEIATRIASYEMAGRLQTSAPELTDLKSESKATLELYGCKADEPSFARACLLARRMVERGVRFVTIYHEGWDAHSDVKGNHGSRCKQTDQGAAALVKDLKARGLLDETLVVWGGEFGRTPMVEANPSLNRSAGRDHHPAAFTMWMAGGGVKAGVQYGKTDDLGFHVAENEVHVHDLQATILHCLGMDHERLTYRYQGRDFRLTDVHGHVVKDLLA
ncbi:MAG: hypothetical protein JWO31_495 [Phycisphaerales bacterium]|nr:hypothetical protein [Phycisphaerales bacterium]